jgi:hypothetical protein
MVQMGFSGSNSNSPGLDCMDRIRCIMGKPSSNGTLDQVYVWVTTDTSTIDRRMMMYNFDGSFLDCGNILTNEVSADNWISSSMITGASITSGQRYYIGFASEQVIRIGYDNTDQSNHNGGAYRQDALWEQWPSANVDTSWPDGSSNSVSIYVYATYTIDGAPTGNGALGFMGTGHLTFYGGNTKLEFMTV